MEKLELKERITKIKSELKEVLDYLDNLKQLSAEERFLQLSNNLVRKYDFKNKPQEVNYYTEDGKFMFQQDFKNGVLFFSDNMVYSVFENEYTTNYQQIQDFIKNMVEKHFNWTGLKPIGIFYLNREELVR